MRTIKIFLGSSITELRVERLFLSDYLLNSVRPIFKRDGVDIEVVKCEDIRTGYKGRSSQEEINDLLKGCDISVFMFKTKAGPQTVREYNVAQELVDSKNHEIYVYCFGVSEEEKAKSLKSFKRKMRQIELYWKTCKDVTDLESQFVIGLLDFERQLLGITKPSSFEQEDDKEKDGDSLFADFIKDEEKQTLRKEKIHQNIEDLLQQIETVMANEDETIAARIFKVIELYKKADRWAAATDYDKKKYSDLLYDYAQFLNKYGLYKDAIEIYLRQIAITEELYGEEHEKTAISYNNIGSVYRNQGDFCNSLKYHFMALEIHEKVFGKDNENTSITYSRIGVAYWDNGDYDKALDFHFKALEIRKTVYGEVHHETANSYNNIGLVYNKIGEYSKALECYKKVLAIDKELFGIEDPNIAPDYNNIALVLENLDKDEEALKYHNKAMAIFEKEYGVKHPCTATSYNNISHIYCKQGKYDKAIEFGFKALNIWEKSLGEEHPNTASVYNILGKAFRKKSQYEEALMYLFKAMAIDERGHDKVHPDTADDYFEIGLVFYSQGDYNKALNYLNKAYLIIKKVFGAEHLKTKDVLESINSVKKALDSSN